MEPQFAANWPFVFGKRIANTRRACADLARIDPTNFVSLNETFSDEIILECAQGNNIKRTNTQYSKLHLGTVGPAVDNLSLCK